MKNIPAVPKPTTPVFLDQIVVQLQDILKNNLSWLKHSFGRSQRLSTIKNGSKQQYPAVHLGEEEYINVFPDQDLGNFSFFIIDDPQSIVQKSRNSTIVSVKYALVFWVNLDTIFTDKINRNTEALKLQIVQLLAKGLFLQNGKIGIDNIYERAENLYKEYDIKEVDSQFLMQPYYGLRFEGEIKYNSFCDNNTIFVGGVPATYNSTATVESLIESMRLDLEQYKLDTDNTMNAHIVADGEMDFDFDEQITTGLTF